MSAPDESATPGRARRPELSLVVPCYNEEDCLDSTIPPLADAFARAGIDIQLVLVDNGSLDGTSRVIDGLVARGLPVTKGVVPVNRGQGLGIRTGFDLCDGTYIGYICADGQVGPEDVLGLFKALRATSEPTLAKVRRRYRPDSWVRKVVSVAYNALMQVVFLGIPCLDVNGNPKILPADTLRMMALTSSDWFLEAEVVLKARALRLPVIEIDVKGLPRGGGRSHVRLATIFEFIRNISAYRFGGSGARWRRPGLSPDTSSRRGRGGPAPTPDR